jgi:GT2 family glycosyltransferase
MTRRELFEQLGGLSDEFPVNYNDVDYCLRLRRLGRRTVYAPDLRMFHFESSSRSSAVEDWEKLLFRERWLPLTAVDPYSNPQLRHELPRPSSKFSWMPRRPRLRRRLPKGQPA